MSKIDNLRDAAIKRDKSSFIDSIFDFSEEDIVRLTEHEFKNVLKYCAMIKLKRVNELLCFIFDEGLRALDDSEIKRDKENNVISRFYFSIFLNLHLEHDDYFARAAGNLGYTLTKLAHLGMNPINNVKESIKLHQETRKIFPENSLSYADSILAQGYAHIILGELGVYPKNNFEKSIRLELEAREIFPENSLSYARAAMNQGNAHLRLGEFGVNPISNLKESIKLQQEVRRIVPENSSVYATATMSQGISYLRLAGLGMDPINNIKESIKLQHEAKKIFPANSSNYACAAMNQGNAYRSLAEFGVDPINSLKESIKLQHEARKIFPANSPNYANATMNQGIVCSTLAELEVDPINNLEESIKLQHEAKKIIENCFDYANASLNQGLAYLLLAEFGVHPINNLKDSIKLLQEAREIIPENSIYSALVSMAQGLAYQHLAKLGFESKDNVQKSIELLQKAREIFLTNTRDYAMATMNLGNSYQILVEFDVEPEKNFKISEELTLISINIFLDIKDGWSYPKVILNGYRLYRNFFWKNGNKCFLEKANNFLKEAEKNIETWNVLRKNEIFGELNAVEADLYELEEDYYTAGIKYRDAFRLTKNEYYWFMCEFCSAKAKSSRREKKPFCKLVDKWKQFDKKGIFFDFYDYAVFECHLEEALENEALRFEEVNKARSKLDEIYARTSIYHIKIRVNACIKILNAYLNYFPEKNEERDEEKAKENVFTACKIFKDQGYQHEIDLCNLFIKAIKNNDKQEVWLDLIKNHLSNNLSKLIGEAAINEMAKLQTIGIKADLGEIKNGIKAMKINIDDLIFSLKPGISEELVITVGAEFYGTGAQHVITIPLQEISYHNLKKDLETIKGKSYLKVTSLPPKLAKKVKEYLIRNKKMIF